MIKTLWVTGFFVFSAFCTGSTTAFAYCFEPTPPFCIDSFSTFEDEFSFRQCRSDLEFYTTQVDDYIECIIDDANQAIARIKDDAGQEIESAQEEAGRTIDRFNCKAQGDTFCP